MESILESFCEDVNDYWINSNRKIKILDNPTHAEFLRECVVSNEPCIIRNAINHWPLYNKTLDEILHIISNDDDVNSNAISNFDMHHQETNDIDNRSNQHTNTINVNITPDGLGDCVKMIDNEPVFVYPAEVSMSIDMFKELLCTRGNDEHADLSQSNKSNPDPNASVVPYLSSQNNNMKSEFKNLYNYIDETLELGAVAFDYSSNKTSHEEFNEVDTENMIDIQQKIHEISLNMDNNLNRNANYVASHDTDVNGMVVIPTFEQGNVLMNTEKSNSNAQTVSTEKRIEKKTKSMGVLPEAVNLWIGDERSVSSVHKDYFENLYCVVSGEKSFTLLPPTDVLYLSEREYPSKQYILKNDINSYHNHMIKNSDLICVDKYVEEDVTLKSKKNPEKEVLNWIQIDPAINIDMNSSLPSNPLGERNGSSNNNCNAIIQPHLSEDYMKFNKYAHPVHVKLQPSEILYIPALWYHRVSQTKLTISVNYWYDMQFDHRFVMYQTIRNIGLLENKKNSEEEKRNA